MSKYRILSEYLGLETMLAIVCSTYEGVNALEKYDPEGTINSNGGLHGIGSSIGRRINGRFVVICLEDLRQVFCMCVCVHARRECVCHVSFSHNRFM